MDWARANAFFVKHHPEHDEAERAAEAVRENWLSLGALIDQLFGEET